MNASGLSKKVFDELFDRYHKELNDFVFSFVNDREAARDLVQDLFFTLWDRQVVLNPQKSVKTFLYTIARNQAFNYLKHRKVMALSEREVAEFYRRGEENTEDIEQKFRYIQKKMGELPLKQYEVVIKCCVEGKRYREVARELGITENTVKTHLVRAMKFLRGELREDFLLLVFLLEVRKGKI